MLILHSVNNHHEHEKCTEHFKVLKYKVILLIKLLHKRKKKPHVKRTKHKNVQTNARIYHLL